MAEDKGKPSQSGLSGEEEEKIPFMQSLLDNHFLLLFIGVAIPTVLYTIWESWISSRFRSLGREEPAWH